MTRCCGVFICLVVIIALAGVIVWEMSADPEAAARHASREKAALMVEKEKSQRERENMRRDRELWEEAKEARIPQGAFWEVVWPAWDCRAYGKREYWGILRGIPEGWSAIDACMNLPVEIRGVTVRRPHRCAFVNGSPHIHGYWMVDWDQPDCKPWYRDYQDAVSPMLLSIHASRFTHHSRDVRALDPASVELRLRSWALTTGRNKIGGYFATQHH